MLWSGDKAWRQSGERRMLCGLQLPGPNNQQLAFQGKVAEIDQSKVWPAGTCLGIDPATNQPTDIPVDCAAPHAMEVTGSVNLAEKFPAGLPPGARAGHVHQGRLHQDDRRLPGADPAAEHHADADLQHGVAAELGGGQPPGVVQHRRHAGQRRVVDAAEQRQGAADDQRPAARSAAGHPRRAAQPAADPDARRPSALVVAGQQLVGLVAVVGGSSTLRAPTTQQRARRSTCRNCRPAPTHADRAGAADRRTAPPGGGNTFLNGPPPPPPPPPGEVLPPPGSARRAAAARARFRRPRPYRARRPSCCRRHRHRHRRGSQPVAVRMSPQRFDELVGDALDLIPPDLAAAIDNVVILVADRNADEPDLLGLYEGIALTERDSWYAGSLPDTITIYREALLDICDRRARGRRRGGHHGDP